MDSHLVVYRSKSGNIDRIKDFISWGKTGRVEGWSATKSFKPGDLVFFYFGSPAKSIIALGKVESEPYTEQGPFDWTKKTKTTSCDFNPVWLLDNPIPLSQFINDPVIAKWYEGRPYRRAHKIPQKVASGLLRKVVAENPKVKNNVMKSGILKPTDETAAAEAAEEGI